MDLFTLILVLLGAGIVCYGVRRYSPGAGIPPRWCSVICLIVIVLVGWWLLWIAGVVPSLDREID